MIVMVLLPLLFILNLIGISFLESSARAAAVTNATTDDGLSIEEMKATVENLKKMNQDLRIQSQGSLKCDFNQTPKDCSFAGLCELYRGNRNKLWLKKKGAINS